MSWMESREWYEYKLSSQMRLWADRRKKAYKGNQSTLECCPLSYSMAKQTHALVRKSKADGIFQ